MPELRDIAQLRVPSGRAESVLTIGPRGRPGFAWMRDGDDLLRFADLWTDFFVPSSGSLHHNLAIPFLFRDGPYLVDATTELEDLDGSAKATWEFRFPDVLTGFHPLPANDDVRPTDIILTGTNLTGGTAFEDPAFLPVLVNSDTAWTTTLSPLPSGLSPEDTATAVAAAREHLEDRRINGVRLALRRNNTAVLPTVPGIREVPIWIGVQGDASDFSGLVVETDDADVLESVASRQLTVLALRTDALEDLDTTLRYRGLIWRIQTTSSPADTRFIELQLTSFAA